MAIGVELKAHLRDLLVESLSFVQENDESAWHRFFSSRLDHLGYIHVYGLPRIPRVQEPVEIVSYLRQAIFAAFGTAGSQKYKDVRVFATESLSNEVHDNFSLERATESLAAHDSNQPILELAKAILEARPKGPRLPLVSLPRIDLNNPCNWPSLLHEIAHIEAGSHENIWQRFCSRVPETIRDVLVCGIGEFSNIETGQARLTESKRWLLECWCDAFAITHSGPAAFFAQLHAFAFSVPPYIGQQVVKGSGYPPAWFRLKILLALSQARLDATHVSTQNLVSSALEEEKQAIFSALSFSETFDIKLAGVLAVMKEFFRTEFPRERSRHAAISTKSLESLLDDLSHGLPIPSLADEGTQTQRAASPAEIMLAGWIHRCTNGRKAVLSLLKVNPDFARDAVVDEIIATIQRADETLKRSLQMSEWFKILDEEAPKRSSIETDQDACATFQHPGVLSDQDLACSLAARELRIIPLIDGHFQVRGTVIDLRLGHNFEVFPVAAPKIFDPMRNRAEDEAQSIEVDVDFGSGIEIGPGQFILAHTLEYIKLPPNVAGQIEGRSSFARIGLQIHMTANLVEAGFDGCLTLEIVNNGPSSIKLYPGMRIAQLRFFRLTTEPLFPYGKFADNKYRGRLAHNKTKQFSDWETNAIRVALQRFGMN
jgi:dCTP deaminase